MMRGAVARISTAPTYHTTVVVGKSLARPMGTTLRAVWRTSTTTAFLVTFETIVEKARRRRLQRRTVRDVDDGDVGQPDLRRICYCAMVAAAVLVLTVRQQSAARAWDLSASRRWRAAVNVSRSRALLSRPRWRR